jgi:hypothetical protein
MKDPLVFATWGLVVATALLFLAALLPVIQGFADRRRQREILAARLIPDMNILRSRFDGTLEGLSQPGQITHRQIDKMQEWCDHELQMVYELLSSREAGMEFVSEIYILRHLLTRASHELRWAHLELRREKQDAESIRRRDKHIAKARNFYGAAKLTIQAAEELLPNWATKIDGEGFWDRFARISTEREKAAGLEFYSSGFVPEFKEGVPRQGGGKGKS